jgi:hypothetical protein
VAELVARFVPAADEVWFLQHRDAPECAFFRGFCEEGHYGGRREPTDTRQGIYCCTPSGRFLASANTTDPRALARMLEQALLRWEQVPEAERYLPEAPDPLAGRALRGEARYPEGGLVLRVTSRDLPREGAPRDWRARAWNRDFAWFRAEEARGFVPEGDAGEVPAALVRRLARCHLVDSVFGQTVPYRDEEVLEARLVATVLGRRDGRVELRFSGRARVEARGSWPMGGLRREVKEMTRGFDAEIEGRGVFAEAEGRFVEFELVATGPRWGGTQYNVRDDDPGPAPMSVSFALAGEGPAERVAPAHLHAY